MSGRLSLWWRGDGEKECTVFQNISESWPITQKARGVLRLARGGVFSTALFSPWCMSRPSRVMVFPYSDGNPPPFSFNKDETVFVRPCPFTPRHGFLESTDVSGGVSGLIVNMMSRVKEADPKGELILMPYLTGRWSAVATNAGVTWGMGNDGATGTGNNPAFIPCPVSKEHWNRTLVPDIITGADDAEVMLVTRAGIKACAYLEIVEDEGKSVCVQLRDGPIQEAGAGNFIPEPMFVKAFITPAEVKFDLMKWETLVVSAKKKGNVALWINSEPNRASHFAVHGIIAGLPVIFHKSTNRSSTPRAVQKLIGTTLNPKEAKVIPLKKVHYEALAESIMANVVHRVGLNLVPNASIEQNEHRVATSIGVCHAMMAWGPERHLIELRAAGVVTCLLYSLAACFGELRHFYLAGPGRDGTGEDEKRERLTKLETFLNKAEIASLHSPSIVCRRQLYASIFSVPLVEQLKMIKDAEKDLEPPGWNSPFGGSSWANVANLTSLLGEALLLFCKKPNSSHWKEVALLYNRTINAAHNGGKVMTKWCPVSAFKAGARAPGFCFLNPFAAEIALGLSDLTRNRNPARVRLDFARKTKEM